MRLDHLLSKDENELRFTILGRSSELSFALSSFEGNIHHKMGA